ncbi:hypothetical protein LZ023_14180 [Pseudomonas silvicola]|nr:hypothetical protein LZ023_14180 [Pseudomonas silvicola]
MNIANTINVYGLSNAVFTSPSMPGTSKGFAYAGKSCWNHLTQAFHQGERCFMARLKFVSRGFIGVERGGGPSLASIEKDLPAQASSP